MTALPAMMADTPPCPALAFGPQVPAHVAARIVLCPQRGCWLWTGADSGTGRGGGYGRTSYLGRTTAVHLLMWRLTGRRLLRPGEQLDHACAVRRCCNPDHLRPLYQPRNVRLAHKRRRSHAAS